MEQALYRALVYTPNRYPEDRDEFTVGIFSDEELAKQAVEIAMKNIQRDWGYSEGDLESSILKYILNKNNYEEAMGNG